MGEDSKRGKYSSPEGSHTWEYFAAFSCALLIFCLGCMAGWNSPTLSILMSPVTPVPLSAADASTLSALTSLGRMWSPILAPLMVAKLGRKRSILAVGIPALISWGVIAITQQTVILTMARFSGGLAIGLGLCLLPIYLGEIASAKLRGAIGMVCSTMINAGVLFMFVIVPYFSIGTTACICLGILICTLICCWLIPESPYYLAMIGKIDEAEGALEKLRGRTEVSEELELIKTTVSKNSETMKGGSDEEKQEAPDRLITLKRLFTVSGNRKALFIALLYMVVLYFGSYVITLIYGQIIFEKMNTGVDAHTCTMIFASLQIVCNILTGFVIDKLGRRPLTLISGMLSGTCLLAVSIYLYLMEYTKVDVSHYGMYALCAVFVNIIAVNIGPVPVHHVIQSEIFATEVKGLAASVIGISAGMMGTISVKTYLTLAETWRLGHSVPFFGFAAITWIATALILKMLPETKGKTLLQIQADLHA